MRWNAYIWKWNPIFVLLLNWLLSNFSIRYKVKQAC